MNDTSHIADVEGLVSPPVESSPTVSFKVVPKDDIFAIIDEPPVQVDNLTKDTAAKKIQEVATKKKEREEAKKIVTDLKNKRSQETEAK